MTTLERQIPKIAVYNDGLLNEVLHIAFFKKSKSGISLNSQNFSKKFLAFLCCVLSRWAQSVLYQM